jgi:hypothetical protein
VQVEEELEASTAEKVPAGQAVQLERPGMDEKVPAGQKAQEVEDGVEEYVPAGQEVHVEEEVAAVAVE